MMLGLVLALALVGMEPAAPGADDGFVAPDWERKPTTMEISSYYPLGSALLGEKGEVVIVCGVSLAGLAENCRIQSEMPAGRGFADAALRMSKIMRFRPAMQNGRPVAGAEVSIPVTFETGLAAAALPGLTEALACYGRYSARLRADAADATAERGARWSRYWASKTMRLQRISKPYREKRLAAASMAFSTPPPRTQVDRRCDAAFLPEEPI